MPATSPLDLRYILGLLNSHLLSVYFQSCFAGNCLQGGYLRVGAPQLRQLPMWIPDLTNGLDRQHYDQLVDRVSDRLLRQAQLPADLSESPHQLSNSVEVQAEIARLDQEIDQLVYRLYQLNDAEIDRLLQLPPLRSKKIQSTQLKEHAQI